MNKVLTIAALCAMPLAASAADCAWTFTPTISDPATDSAFDVGGTYLWMFEYYADHFTISGQMLAIDFFGSSTISLSKAATGNGTFRVERIIGCSSPQEDIEAYARNEFKAFASLHDEDAALAAGSLLIEGGSCDLLCNAIGGVTLTAVALQEGQTSGTVSLSLWGATVSINWAMGGGDDLELSFSDSDLGSGGTSIEVFTAHTSLQLDVNIGNGGWFDDGDSAAAKLKDAKYEFMVWGTCAGYCGNTDLLCHAMGGY